MTEQLYVATDARGVQHAEGGDVTWHLPPPSGPASETVAPGGGRLALRTAAALVDELDERIFVAAPAGATTGLDGIVEVGAARLVAETAWDVATAARFALDCAEHVLGEAADAPLPGGATLGEIVTDARRVLERSGDGAEQRLGLLARLFAARRLRHRGEVLGDVAFETLVEDSGEALEALDDPAWAAVATVRDAVLGAVEAVRYLALPRYIAARESAYEETRDGDADPPSTAAGTFMTPWGPITIGAEHHRGFEPAWVAARDTALRARDTVRGTGGDDDQERSWQAARLAELLAPHAS